MTLQTVDEVLDAAARYMDLHGQVKNEYEDYTGRVCVKGAMSRVLTGDRYGSNQWQITAANLYHNTIAHLQEVINRGNRGELRLTVDAWNMIHTKRDVVAGLQEAAIEYRMAQYARNGQPERAVATV